MSKQDRQGARTVAELDRRYNVKKAMGVANDSLKASQQASVRAEQASKDVGDKLGKNDDAQVITMINRAKEIIKLLANRLVIESTNFTLSAEGSVVARDITLKNSNTAGDYQVSIADGVMEINSPTEIVSDGIFQQIDLLHFNIQGYGVYRLYIVVDNQDGDGWMFNHFGISPVTE